MEGLGDFANWAIQGFLFIFFVAVVYIGYRKLTGKDN
jgi:cbb3-type cytochrome oxidase subunit 3